MWWSYTVQQTLSPNVCMSVCQWSGSEIKEGIGRRDITKEERIRLRKCRDKARCGEKASQLGPGEQWH